VFSLQYELNLENLLRKILVDETYFLGLDVSVGAEMAPDI